MKNRKTLWIMTFAIAGTLLYNIFQHKNIQQLEFEKTVLSKELDSLKNNLKTNNMAAYIIFIKEKTTNQDELNIYAKEAPAGLVGHNITTLAAYEKIKLSKAPM